jgi:hypothetical protein
MTCAIGLVFETAALVDIHLFEQDRLPLAASIKYTSDMLALLPRRIKSGIKAADDDFYEKQSSFCLDMAAG